jgi:hypothetical protein
MKMIMIVAGVAIAAFGFQSGQMPIGLVGVGMVLLGGNFFK